MHLFIKKLFTTLIIVLSVLYLCLAVFALTYSDKLIFLPPPATYAWSKDLISIHSNSSSAAGIKNTIVARYLKYPDSNYTILYSHGNAVDLGGLQHLQKNFNLHGYSIISYDYSGYGLSEGKPSEQQVYNDVEAVYAYLRNHENLRPEQITSFGHSLGAAVATELAFKKPIAGLILESPFTSAFQVMTIYPLLPFDKFSNIDKIDKINTPFFIAHSRDDAVVPFWHSESLFYKAKQPKTALWLAHEGHANITHNQSFWIKLNAFIHDFIAPASNM